MANKNPSLEDRENDRVRSQRVIKSVTQSPSIEDTKDVADTNTKRRGRPAQKEELKVISVYLKPEQHRDLKIKGAYEDKDVSCLIREAVDEFLKKESDG